METNENMLANQLSVNLATPSDLPDIFRLKHQVYADELGQHATNSEGSPLASSLHPRDRVQTYGSFYIADIKTS